MKQRVLCALLVMVVIAGVSRAQVSDQTVANGKEIVDMLNKGQFAEVAAKFDGQMTQLLPADKLEQTWKQLISQVGSFKQISEASYASAQGMDVALLTCDFEKMKLLASVAFNSDKKISGLRFVPK